MKKIRKGDTVVLIAGRDKGRRGTVIEVLECDRVRVEGLNMSKKHQRPNPQMGVQGGIIEREAPLHVSNVLIFNPASRRATGWASRRSRTAARSACSSRTKKWSTPNDAPKQGSTSIESLFTLAPRALSGGAVLQPR